MEQLFDKPMSELREAFVRARFAEPAMFGRPDIEEWQSALGFSTIPFSRTPELPRHFNRIWKGVNLSEVLRTKATPLTEPPDWHLFRMKSKGGDPDAYVAIIRALQMGGAHVYYPWNNSDDNPPILLVGNEIFAIDSPYQDFQPFLSLWRAGISTVLDVLNGEIIHDRPKANEARELFKTEAGNAITVAREAAQRDFDEACAVSADGAKIVKADWVLVGSNSEDRWSRRALLYPNDAFKKLKLLIAEKAEKTRLINHNVLASTGRTIEKYITYRLCYSPLWGQLHSDCTGLIGDIYFVDKNNCPSPLPDGGREIRV